MGYFGTENGTSSTLDWLYEFHLKFCRMKGANRFMKILLVDFREKFCKASLRICYISLFEYKGPWMQKSGSLIF